MSRITNKASTLALLAILVLTGARTAAAADGTFVATAGEGVVAVEQGQLMGFRDRGIYTFRGVPYAKAERFMPPQAPDSWEGVRLAMNYGEICPIPVQSNVSTDEQFNAHRYFPQNENCQFLNIWTPSLNPQAGLPVLVFLHGGGYTNGSSIEGYGYDGRNFAELGDAVVITLNHRLNVLGMMDLSQFGGKWSEASNAGMRDIVAALEWVQQNIAQFGGDADNVTIMGQSGGGGKVAVMMGVPAAADLFDKAVIMSGTANVASSRAIGDALGRHLVEALGLTADTLDQIQELPYQQLLDAAEEARRRAAAAGVSGNLGFRPSVDGSFMPVDPVDPGWSRYAADKPLLVGNVTEEFETIIRNDNSALFADNWNNWSDQRAMAELTERYGNQAQAIAAAWREAFPRESLARANFFAPTWRSTVLNFAELKSSQGSAPVYVYLYNWVPPVLDGAAGAWHVADVHMAFYNADNLPQSFGGGEAARSMSYDVARAWANFMRSGNPTHSGLPVWSTYTPRNPATMVLDDYSTLGVGFDRRVLDLMLEAGE